MTLQHVSVLAQPLVTRYATADYTVRPCAYHQIAVAIVSKHTITMVTIKHAGSTLYGFVVNVIGVLKHLD